MSKTKATRPLTKAASIFIIVAVGVVFVNYFFNLPGLRTILHYSQINFNAAVCFLLSGIVLFLLDSKSERKKKRILVYTLSLVIVLFAGLTLVEWFLGRDLFIDQLFYTIQDVTPVNATVPRMDPLICILFLITGAIYLLIGNKKFHLPIQVLLITCLMLEGLIFAIVSAVIFNFREWRFLSPFLHTSFVFFILFLGILFSEPLGYIRFSFQKQIAGFFTLVVLSMSFLFLGIRNVDKQREETSRMVEISNEIISQNRQILSYSQGMEMSTRGYIISGNQVFVEAIQKYIPLLEQSISHLKELTADSPSQQRKVDSLGELMTTNIEIRKQLIKTRSTSGFDSANKVFEKEIVQKRMMGRLNEVIVNIEKNESLSLSTRKTDHLKSIGDLSKIIDLFYVILVLLLFFSFIIIYKNTRARNKAEEKIRLLNATLEQRVAEKTEEGLLQEAKYRFLLENMQEGIQVISFDWRYLFVNNSLVGQSKYLNDELLGYTMMEKYPGIENTPLFKVLTNSMEQRISQLYENEFTYPDGQKGWYQLSIQPVPEGIFILSMDISERKKVQDEKNSLLDTIQKSVNEIYTFSPATLRFQYVNNSALKNTGFTIEEIYGLTVLDIKPDITPEYFNELVAPLRSGEEKIVFITNHRRKDGSLYPVESHIQLIRQDNQDIFLIVALDITDRVNDELVKKQLNENLEKRAKELLSSNKELERFAYVASHDLQEPLRMVSSFLQLLEKRLAGSLDPTSKRYIDFAVDGSERMKILIRDLLEYSRVNRIRGEVTEIDCNKVLSNVVNLLKLSISERKVNLQLHSLPVIRGIQSQVHQLFQNLLVNAIKYNNNPYPEIEVGFSEENQFWQFYVKDNGMGIDPKYFDRIFILFQRLHNKTEYSGTGIGLTVCKKIVEGHGGEIWVTSEVSKGSTFYFTISKNII